jgi:hypothetical protein
VNSFAKSVYMTGLTALAMGLITGVAITAMLVASSLQTNGTRTGGANDRPLPHHITHRRVYDDQ